MSLKAYIYPYRKNVKEDNRISSFLKEFHNLTVEQNPFWIETVRNGEKSYIVEIEDEGILVGYSLFISKHSKLAYFYFGPLILARELANQILNLILDELKSKGFWAVYFIGMPIDEHQLAKLNFQYPYSSGDLNVMNWATLQLNLEQPLEQIEKNYSENHRRNIKKAHVNNLRLIPVNDKSDAIKMANGFCDMYIEKGLKVNREVAIRQFQGIFDILQTNPENGRIYKTVSNFGKLIGGIILLRQGDSYFYFRGYSNKDVKLPINHFTMSEAIKNARVDGVKIFDFGGYALGKVNSQLEGINRFKEGFGGTFVKSNPTLTIYLKPQARAALGLIQTAKALFKK